ncbi:GNAT family N-acetyltransferase [Marinirhabdus gelatinilytica]|uniref:Acetyltransferase (GNAT) family protein n=1 Tax=Marinirhabdus gelatinilytica TaxID=1703343 RepID=A0A370QJ37_9FLAO|nr:GNAT family N-acetyltransferase [Marinirhabdus gelatinilytica]RDK88356.1 acetyltransferase (GNAT) family protein [Marinirhabdus gelatinilytica]
MNTAIRKAEKQDMPQVLELIKELAAFENEPNAVEVTVAELEREGFENNLFTCFVAEVENNIVGMALVYFRFSTWKGRTVHLEDLVVNKAYRGNGIGSELFKKVMGYARAQGVRRAEWIVLDWNKGAIAMYEKHKAIFHKDWWLVEMNEQELKKYNS